MTEQKSAYWLTKRSEFLRAAKGRRFHTALFTIQAVTCEKPDAQARFGLTVTSKAGNAVERNRMKRRLREALRLSARTKARPAVDYVIIGRRDILSAPFETLVRELDQGVERIKPTPPDFKPNSVKATSSKSSLSKSGKSV